MSRSEETTSLLLDVGYGRTDITEPHVFADTKLPDTGRLFTAEFALRAYTALSRTSIDNERPTIPFGLFQKECFFIKAKMEELNVKDDAVIRTFLSNIKGIVEHVEKDIAVSVNIDERKKMFLCVVEQLMTSITAFIKQRRPDLTNLDVVATYPDISNKSLVSTVSTTSENYMKTNLSDRFLFTKAFATTVYRKLLNTNLEKKKTIVENNGPLPKIKDKIEIAKTVDDIISLVNIVYNAMVEAKQKNDSALSGCFPTILKDIGQYIAITHPAVSKEVVALLRSRASDDKRAECGWIMLCGVNAAVQFPLNAAWCVLSVATLGTLPALYYDHQNDSYTGCCPSCIDVLCDLSEFAPYFYLPYDKRYKHNEEVNECCRPISSMLWHCGRWSYVGAISEGCNEKTTAFQNTAESAPSKSIGMA
ncbi:MAG: hypothetical protein ACD_42C00077G0006 [uncultured bacterium]|nr:MAG: hypothetical protein ACD_42C00077G0006 [uncultured bacterium]OGT32895.1 MAG: hypothetical protein A3C44_04990 [Gammaproteobacteria bacterium RIFCSPHIGHO2_02_FULL_39_13]OGT50553.1 MAG: hypothetical protein A3E53_03425 [Gammaproteobacteria bacterium RIFCSPHIGHO2_12_FULL_39_24]